MLRANLTMTILIIYCYSCSRNTTIGGDIALDNGDVSNDTHSDEVETVDIPLDERLEATAEESDVYLDTIADPPEDEMSIDVVCPENMAMIPDTIYCIDNYEASRIDATSTNHGSMVGPAQSTVDVMPWNFVTWSEASTACIDAGKQLCPQHVWYNACSRNGYFTYPYGSTYNPLACVGTDYTPGLQPTGRAPCEGGYEGIFDMSGNIAEWINDCDGDNCMVAGGYYGGNSTELRCDSSLPFSSDWDIHIIGFRCCKRIE